MQQQIIYLFDEEEPRPAEGYGTIQFSCMGDAGELHTVSGEDDGVDYVIATRAAAVAWAEGHRGRWSVIVGGAPKIAPL